MEGIDRDTYRQREKENKGDRACAKECAHALKSPPPLSLSRACAKECAHARA